ncbi:MAG: hypothetical protein COB66_01285 [Coxiella sp. (in: Bacteria)]|nr:MAG: hypothetical protein COB66_01285 [Coxiella sp. (in: g-proteobacteria)]
MTTQTDKPRITLAAERKFQHYHCARPSMKMITHKGTVIVFVAHKFITENEEIIAYLNSEIAAGCDVVTKGELLTELEADPMASLRERIIKEEAERIAAAAQKLQEDTAQAAMKGTGIVSSDSLVTAGASNSSASASAPTGAGSK